VAAVNLARWLLAGRLMLTFCSSAQNGWDENDLATRLRPHGVRPGMVYAEGPEGEKKPGRDYELEAVMAALGTSG
jgi:hypothetical protein